MKVTWWGYSCFSVGNGKTVVLDPHDGDSIGLPSPSTEADVILSTHSHVAHFSPKAVEGHEKIPVVEGERGDLAVRGLEIKGLRTFHDASEGEELGENTVLRFLFGGMYFCHLGDLGHALGSGDVEEFSPVDVLFVPVGGSCTIGPKEAAEVVEGVEPSLVFPMHYATPGLEKDLGGLEPFLDAVDGEVVEVEGSSYEVSGLPSRRRVVVLELPE